MIAFPPVSQQHQQMAHRGTLIQPGLFSLANQFLRSLYKSLEGTITTGNGKENVGIEKKNEE